MSGTIMVQTEVVRLIGPQRSLELFGVRLVGVNAENGKKLLFTLLFLIAVLLFSRVAHFIARRLPTRRVSERAAFWVRQGINLGTALILILGLASIWFDDPTRLTTALGLLTAGLAFALQKVVTAVAGYFVILRGKTFNVGDRIVMGGVRGDVIALGFTQTTIMEMGQPPPVQQDDPAMWVKSRQYTGRIVSVSNAKIFDEPVYNYTREFPYVWEEMTIPVPYTADRGRAERVLLDITQRHTVPISELSENDLEEMQRRYMMRATDLKPRVYYRLTDNWLELTVRFIAKDHAIRELKDAIGRDILQQFDREGIPIASATFEIVGIPPLEIQEPPRLEKVPRG
jgi:small-conductance mechanosensitive channel